MRLLDTTTLTFGSSRKPRSDLNAQYAVLSHRWAEDNESEVLYTDIVSGEADTKPCYPKLKGAADLAKREGFQWIWIDTCCINKESSAELTESINSMYQWYRDASCCYVYMQDIDKESTSKPFYESEWFERGWTLQELLSPPLVKLYDRYWQFLGTKTELAPQISTSTGIDQDVLQGQDLRTYSVAQRMSWAARRQTTRPEDLAYCLLGIFDVNITPIYGEGAEKAFMRLQEEIIKHDDDHSIFAWSMNSELSGLLAPEPLCFQNCSAAKKPQSTTGRNHFSMTNRGLSIRLRITPWAVDTYLAFIDSNWPLPSELFWCLPLRLGVFLRRLPEEDQYARVNFDGKGGVFADVSDIYRDCYDEFTARPIRKVKVFVRQSLDAQHVEYGSLKRENAFQITGSLHVDPVPDKINTKVQTIHLDNMWCLKVLDVLDPAEFKQIAFGFDFDFNPVCLLVDATIDILLNSPTVVQRDVVKGDTFAEVIEGSRVYWKCDDGDRAECTYDGILRLKGHRQFGLEVVVMHSFQKSGPEIYMYRKEEDPLVWQVEVNTTSGRQT